MDPDIVLEAPQWQAAFDFEPLAHRAIRAVLDHLGLAGQETEISILACDDARIADLNAAFREKPQPTNVLSWPAQDVVPPDLPQPGPDGAVELGDIALAFETCAREAADQGKSMQDHVTHLLVHGMLHLLGYDHVRDQDATVMEALEVEILGKLGLPDPYS